MTGIELLFHFCKNSIVLDFASSRTKSTSKEDNDSLFLNTWKQKCWLEKGGKN